MAGIKITNSCLICGGKLEPGKAIYLNKVNLVDSNAYGCYLTHYQLRVQGFAHSKPKGGIHLACYEEKIQPLIGD